MEKHPATTKQLVVWPLLPQKLTQGSMWHWPRGAEPAHQHQQQQAQVEQALGSFALPNLNSASAAATGKAAEARPALFADPTHPCLHHSMHSAAAGARLGGYSCCSTKNCGLATDRQAHLTAALLSE
jgi:hypothetical protein